jgi:hypothetical protein
MTYATAWPFLTSTPEPVPPPVIVVRPPLPPFDTQTTDPETGAPLPVYTELRAEPPATADVRWWRGDAWGLTIPGLPPVAGGANGPAQNRVLTYFLDRYGHGAWEDRILKTYCSYGYSHISLSPQDSFEAGLSEDAYVAMSVRCREAGLFVHHLMRSKYYTPTPPDLSAPDALIERLLAEGAMQIETPAWECNHWSPEIVRAMIDHDAALIGTRCRIMLHFFPHYISWQPNDETPTDFWRANFGKVDGVLYQCDPAWTAGMMAARATDCLDRLAPGGVWGLGDSGRGHPLDFTVWETIATCQFGNGYDGDGRLATEDIGNLKGYECGNAPGLMVAAGYGNGGRRPDGARL